MSVAVWSSPRVELYASGLREPLASRMSNLTRRMFGILEAEGLEALPWSPDTEPPAWLLVEWTAPASGRPFEAALSELEPGLGMRLLQAFAQAEAQEAGPGGRAAIYETVAGAADVLLELTHRRMARLSLHDEDLPEETLRKAVYCDLPARLPAVLKRTRAPRTFALNAVAGGLAAVEASLFDLPSARRTWDPAPALEGLLTVMETGALGEETLTLASNLLSCLRDFAPQQRYPALLTRAERLVVQAGGRLAGVAELVPFGAERASHLRLVPPPPALPGSWSEPFRVLEAGDARWLVGATAALGSWVQLCSRGW